MMTFRWASPFSIGLPMALAVAGLLVYGLIRWAGGGPLDPARRWGLRAIRGLILGVLALILLNPVRVQETPGAVERPKVVYLVHTSQSMTLGQGDRSRWSEMVATLREADRLTSGSGSNPAAPEVGVFRFGSRLAAVDSPFWRSAGPGPAPVPVPVAAEPPPAPTDSETLLSGSLEALAGRFGPTPPRAAVVFSDGRARDPERAEAIARGFGRMGIPIHVVPAGSEEVGGDVAIVGMVTPNLVRKTSKVPVQVFIRSYGYRGRRADLKLSAIGPDGKPGATLARLPVDLQDGLVGHALTYESGEQDRRIVATIDPQPGEASAENNRFAADVAIDRTKIRVLYIEGSNEQTVTRKGRFGMGGAEVTGAYTPLQKAITADPDVECTVVLPVGSGEDLSMVVRSDDRGRGLPESPSELYAYDAIILSDVPREVLDDKFMGWIEEWVGRRGGGLGMVGGPNAFGSGRWAATPIGRMLPVEVETGGADWDAATAAIRPVVGGSVHPIWQLVADDAQNRKLLDRIPAFLGHNRLGPAKPSAEILGRVGSGATAPVGIAIQPFGRGRSMAISVGTTPRLAAEFVRSWGEGGDARYFQKFWRNTIYWLTENSSVGRRRLLAETDKRLYRPGEPIALRARAFDENASATLDYRIAVSIEPRSAAEVTSDNSPLRRPATGPAPAGPLLPWGEEFALAKVAADRSYAADLPIAEARGLPPGVALTGGIRIELTAYENNTQVDSTAIDVQILDDPGEMQNPLPDHDLLRRIATGSGGRVLRSAEEIAGMLARLPVAVAPPEVKEWPAWDRWWLLTTLIALLTIEWAWRRRLGLA